MKAIEILEELCQRLRWVQQHPDVELPHEHKRIAELVEIGKDDQDVATIAELATGPEADIEAAWEFARECYRARRNEPALRETQRTDVEAKRLDISAPQGAEIQAKPLKGE